LTACPTGNFYEISVSGGLHVHPANAAATPHWTVSPTWRASPAVHRAHGQIDTTAMRPAGTADASGWSLHRHQRRRIRRPHRPRRRLRNVTSRTFQGRYGFPSSPFPDSTVYGKTQRLSTSIRAPARSICRHGRRSIHTTGFVAKYTPAGTDLGACRSLSTMFRRTTGHLPPALPSRRDRALNPGPARKHTDLDKWNRPADSFEQDMGRAGYTVSTSPRRGVLHRGTFWGTVTSIRGPAR